MAQPETIPALNLSGVFQHLGGHCALSGVDLRVEPGEWRLIAGPNGAGKSLLARLILGLDLPSAGTIDVLGQDIGALGWRGMTRLRGRLGAVLQGGSLLDGLSVIENLVLPIRDLPWGAETLAREARLAVTLLTLDGLENHRPRALSLGQRRRVELARALIHRPDLLVWDGLTDGLDPAATLETLQVLSQIRESRKLTLIAMDNDPQALAGVFDRVSVLERGRMIFDGTPAELTDVLPSRLDLRYLLSGKA